MLQPRHLAVIRAALQYWDEEQSPHGEEAFTGYIEEPVPEGPLTRADVEYLRDRLRHCELRYALCDDTGAALISDQLFDTVAAAEDAGSAEAATVATVFICR